MARILQGHMPKPGCRGCRQPQRGRESKAVPLASSCETVLVKRENRGAARAEERDRGNRSAVVAEIDSRRAPFNLVAQKKVQENVTAIHTPDRSIRVHLGPQARWAGDMDRISCGGEGLSWHSKILHFWAYSQ